MNIENAYPNGSISQSGRDIDRPVQERSTMMGDFLNELEAITSNLELHTLNVRAKLNGLINTENGFKKGDDQSNPQEAPRGNGDLEETLFRSIARLREVQSVLYLQVEKLNNII